MDCSGPSPRGLREGWPDGRLGIKSDKLKPISSKKAHQVKDQLEATKTSTKLLYSDSF
jgi:hypothetical protein